MSTIRPIYPALILIILLVVSLIFASPSAAALPAPGGVDTSLELWLKASDGLTTSGTTVTAWADQSGNGYSADAAPNTNQPNTGPTINFNPSLQFVQANDEMLAIADAPGLNPASDMSMFVVGKFTSTANYSPFAVKTTQNAWHDGYGLTKNFGSEQMAFWKGRWATTINVAFMDSAVNQVSVMTGYYDSGTHDNYITIDGQTPNNDPVTAAQVASVEPLLIGGASTNSATSFHHLEGEIAEIVMYNGAITALQRQKVESYLAIKYGVTLDTITNYIDSAGNVVWDHATNTGYTSDIAGVGVDNDSSLSQPASSSVNASRLITGTATLANIASGEFLLWGHNGSGTSFSVPLSPSPSTADVTMGRVWKVQETGDVGVVRISIPNTTAFPTSSVRELIVSNDATFDNADTTIALTDDGTFLYADVNLTDGQYFTFASQLPPGPGGVATALGLWVKADSDVTLAGSNVSQWDDAFGNGHSFVRETTTGPVFFDGANNTNFNFNPYLDFNGLASRLADLDIGTLGSTQDQTILAIVRHDGSNQYFFTLRSADNSITDMAVHSYKIHSLNRSGDYIPGGSVPSSNATILIGGRDGDSGLDGSMSSIFNGLVAADSALTNNSDNNFATGIARIGTNRASGFSTLSYQGMIGEIVLFERELNNTELAQVMSYLAIKYGITLDASGDYVNGANTTLWDSTANAAYHNDIAGIARDDNGTLNQPKSISNNSDALVTIDGGTLATDASALLWGNNDGTTTFDVTAGSFVHMGRIWKISESGTVGSVTLSVPNSTGATLLLIDDDGDFSAGAMATTLTDDGTNLTSSVNFADGQFFTLSNSAPPAAAPGGVSPDLQLWLKADADAFTTGTTAAADGQTVATWADQSGTGNDFTQATAASRPTLRDGAQQINNNPLIEFDGTDDHLEDLTFSYDRSLFDETIFLVGRMDTDLNSTFYDGATGRVNRRLYARDSTPSTNPHLSMASVDGVVLKNTTVPLGDWFVHGGIWTDGGGMSVRSRVNSTETSGVDITPEDELSSDFRLGNVGSTPLNTPLDGTIAEVIVYNTTLSDADIQKVESYLAFKYGITLEPGNDYVKSSNGFVIWDGSDPLNTPYHNDIAGVYIDSTSGLNQLSSRSINSDSIVTMTGSAPDFTDGELQMWGNDDGATAFTGAGSISGLATANDIFGRKWRVRASGDAGTLTIEFDNAAIQSGETYCFIYDDDGDYTNGGTVEDSCATATGTTVTFTHDFTSASRFFTLGKNTIAAPAPGGVAPNLQLWLKANAGIGETDGQTLTVWSDQSPNGYSADTDGSDGTTSPTVRDNATANINGNPVVEFDGVENSVNLGSDFIYSTNDGLTMIAVAAPDTSSNAAQFIIDFGAWTGSGYGMIIDENRVYAYTPGTYGGGVVNANHSFGTQPMLASANVTFGSEMRLFNNGLSVADTPITLAQLTDTELLEVATHGSGGPVTIGRQAKVNTGGDRRFEGRIAEVIIYDSSLDATEHNQVESYLAIKYGISLANGVDYVRSDGTRVRNATNDAAYHNDIAGIGIDANSGLSQLSSRSVNADSILTMTSAGIATDGVYQLWGNDDGPTAFQGAGTLTGLATANDIFGRTWKASGIGNAGIATIDFDSTALTNGETYCLIVDDDGDFTNGGTVEELCTVAAGGTVSFSYDFVTNNYFTLGKFTSTISPGGVFPNLQLWLKADEGVSASGSNVTAWEDQSSQGHIISQGTVSQQPDFVASAINNNPALQFNGASDFLTTSDVVLPLADAQTLFALVVANNEHSFLNQSVGLSDNFVNPNFWGNGRYIVSDIRPGFSDGAGGPLQGEPVINMGTRTSNVGGATATFQNGLAVDSNPSLAAMETRNYNGFYLGARQQACCIQYFDGQAAEVIGYNRVLSAAERNQVESYLAVKYGVTLDSSVNYVRSDGNVAWNATTGAAYYNDVAGIGVDAGSGLSQLRSRSVNADSIVTMSAPSLNDGTFLMWGNDNGATTFVGAGSITGLATVNDRLTRTWQAMGLNNAGVVTVTFDTTELVAGRPHCLLVDTDGDFTNGGTTEIDCKTPTGSSVAFSYQFNNTTGRFFTLGALTNIAPVAVDDSYMTNEDTTLTIAASGILTNDTDADNDTLTAVLGNNVSNGSLTLNADGSFSYTPNFNFVGTDTFTYFANDGTVNSDAAATVTMTVLPDTDGDGVPNSIDIDDDGDGITDALEGEPTLRNSDGDAFPDYLDIDSDNDGLPDIVEAQTTVGYQLPLGTDGDGDGWDDRWDSDNGGTAPPIINFDAPSDTIPDYLDADTDNDALPDLFENGMNIGLRNVDSDADGLDDAFEGVNVLDDNRPNDEFLDPTVDIPDFDNDVQLGGDVDYRDDGPLPNDTDGDGVPNDADLDDDNDGITDEDEGLGLRSASPTDQDRDGIPNYLDLDSDNNGMPDTVENQAPDANFDGVHDGWDEADPDTNNNGWLDSLEATNPTPLDNDNDGVANFLDSDNYNYGVLDTVAYNFPDEDSNGVHDGWLTINPDVDLNGWLDILQTQVVRAAALPLVIDPDQDGVFTARDADYDGDGIPDVIEIGFPDENNDNIHDGWDAPNPDTNDDGVLDILDPALGGTPFAPRNSDNDAQPDFRDIDDDDDGIPSNIEAQVLITYVAPALADDNGDGIDNNYDPTFAGGAALLLVDNDGDGKPDYLDRDSNNDYLPDSYNNGLGDEPSGVDDDDDGLDNAFEHETLDDGYISNDGIDDPLSALPDTDNNGTPDILDSTPIPANVDGDTIPDVIEPDGDRDGDGIADKDDFDPTGYFYEETTGRIIPGGTIQVIGPGAVTIHDSGAEGFYRFTTDQKAGLYTIQVTPPEGFALSFACPSMAALDPVQGSRIQVLGAARLGAARMISDTTCAANPYHLTIQVEPDDPILINNNIALRSTTDYGDLPETYGATLFFDDGARHEVGTLFLGSGINVEPDGQPSADSSADSLDNGITIANNKPWFINEQSELNVTITGGPGHLVGWFDWNQNNVFDVLTETVDFGVLEAGEQSVMVTVHDAFDTFNEDPLVVRFRLFPVDGNRAARLASPLHGYAANGEVEDYVWEVPKPRYYFPIIIR